MGKYIVCLITSIIIGIGVTFADIQHTVGRGETIESIAEKYGITTERLLEVNKDASTLFYIGQRLKIPIAQKNEHDENAHSNINAHHRMISAVEQGLSEDAKRYFENKNWEKAVKTYSKLIKKYPRAIYYYNRGLSHMNNNKNRQAANDFKKALSMDDCTSSILKNSPRLLAEAEKRHSEWKNRQANLIGGIVLGVAAAGVTTWAVIESSKIESVDNGNMYVNSVASENPSQLSNMNEVFNQIMAKTIQEGQFQEQVEYNQARTAWQQMTGNDLSIDEWRAQKGQALMNMQAQGIDVNVDTNSNDDYWSETNRKERQRRILNTVVGEKCSLCKGSRKCHACHGSKIASGMGIDRVCTSCNDKGDCPACNGTGLSSWNR